MELHEYSIGQIQKKIQNKEISVQEITRAVLQRIAEVEDNVKAYLTITDEAAIQKAKKIDENIQQGTAILPLTGIPMALKDNICTEGIKTTCASKILENFIPPYNATVVEMLNRQQTVLLGKLNMDEFAMGSSNENSSFFNTRNPWDLKKVPGGSSGGSAACVAADEAFFTLGSDTGGSIRQPAAFCGIVGLKPTYGRVSRYGLVAYASSLDQIGSLTKDVQDAAIVLQALAGHDPLDATSANLRVPDYPKALTGDIKGIKIGVPKEYFPEELDGEVKRTVMAAVSKLQELGAVVEECSMPSTEHALTAYYILASAEASSNLARFDGVRYGFRSPQAEDVLTMYKKTRQHGFGPEVKNRIMLGTYALSSGYYDAYYMRALKVRTLIKKDFDEAYKKYDCLLTPTSPTVAFDLGERVDDSLSMYLADLFTIPANMAGVPAISIPCGFSEKMPVGLQIIGKGYDEQTILKVAYAYEQATQWHQQKPVL